MSSGSCFYTSCQVENFYSRAMLNNVKTNRVISAESTGNFLYYKVLFLWQ